MREKIEYDSKEQDILKLLGISEERRLELENCDFIHPETEGDEHTQTDHIMAAYNRDDITDKELLYVMYDVGFNNGQIRTAQKAANLISNLIGGAVGAVAVGLPEALGLKEDKQQVH